MAGRRGRKTPGKTGVFWTEDRDDLEIVKVHVPGVNLEPDLDIKAPMVKMPLRSRQPRIVTLNRKSCLSLDKMNQPIDVTEGGKPKKDEPVLQELPPKKSTLKDLGPEDKRRIANLVKELAKVGEERETAMVQLNEEREAFEERLNILQEEYDRVIDEKLYIQNRFLELQGLLKKYNTGNNIENVRLSPPKSLSKSASKVSSPMSRGSPLSQTQDNVRQREPNLVSPLKKKQQLSRQSTPSLSSQKIHQRMLQSEKSTSALREINQTPSLMHSPAKSTSTRQSPSKKNLSGHTVPQPENSTLYVPENLYPNASFINRPSDNALSMKQTEASSVPPSAYSAIGESSAPANSSQVAFPSAQPVLVANQQPIPYSATKTSIATNHTQLPSFNGQIPGAPQMVGPITGVAPFPGQILPGNTQGVSGPQAGMIPLMNLPRPPSDTSQSFMSELDTVYRLYYREYELQLQLQQQQLELQKQQLQLQQQLQQLEVLQQQQKQTTDNIKQADTAKTVVQETPVPLISEKLPRQQTTPNKPQKSPLGKPPKSPVSQRKVTSSHDQIPRQSMASPANHHDDTRDDESEVTPSRSPANRRKITRKVARRSLASHGEFWKENAIPATDQSESSFAVHQALPSPGGRKRDNNNGYEADSSQVSGSVRHQYTGRPTGDEYYAYELREPGYELQRRADYRDDNYRPEMEGYEMHGPREMVGHRVQGRGPRDRGNESYRSGMAMYGQPHGRAQDPTYIEQYNAPRSPRGRAYTDSDGDLPYRVPSEPYTSRGGSRGSEGRVPYPGYVHGGMSARSYDLYTAGDERSHLMGAGHFRQHSARDTRARQAPVGALDHNRRGETSATHRSVGAPPLFVGSGHEFRDEGPFMRPLNASSASSRLSHELSYPEQIFDIVEEMETDGVSRVSSKNDLPPRPLRSPRLVPGLVLESTDSGYSHVSQETPRDMASRLTSQSDDRNYETEVEEYRVLEDIFFVR